jgi:hypothetical protein
LKSFDEKYLKKLIVPHHLITVIRQIGEYRGKQELFTSRERDVLQNGKKFNRV